MKLIGVPLLFALAQRADPPLRGAALALHAELAAARWSRIDEVLAAFPNAEHEPHRLIVELGDGHCAVVSISYEASIAVIEFAGRRADRTVRSPLNTGDRA